MLRHIRSATRHRSQRGFSLVELSIALLLALFLLGGLLTILAGTRRSGGTQSALSQLQDNQRIAMTLITNIIQKAGYYPYQGYLQLSSFQAETFSGAPLVASVSLASSQVVGGTSAASAYGDTFAVRFLAPYGDTSSQIINCAGQSNTVAWPGSYNVVFEFMNVFQVAMVNGTPWLQCIARSVNNGGFGPVYTVNLIPNVTNMAVLYGVGTNANAAAGDFSIVQYLTAAQVTASNNWSNVTSLKVTLTFLMPQLGTTGGQMMSATAPGGTTTFQRVIPIMSRAGVNVI